MKRYLGPHGPKGKCLSFPVTQAYSPSCLWGYVFSNPMGTGMQPLPSLTFPIYQIDPKFS